MPISRNADGWWMRSNRDYLWIRNQTEEADIRGFIFDDGSILVWDAYHHDHQDMFDNIEDGGNPELQKNIETSISVNGGDGGTTIQMWGAEKNIEVLKRIFGPNVEDMIRDYEE